MSKLAEEVQDSFYESFLELLNNKISHPTPDLPTVRYWTTSSLKKILAQVRKELAEKDIVSDSSYVSLIEWLRRIGFEREVLAEGETFHVIEIGAGTRGGIDPLELLMAVRPQGVICYFSAIAFHSLTTQPVQHHHVAELQVSKPHTKREAESQLEDSNPRPLSISPPRLGSELFRYEGKPYFTTKRSIRLIPGIQVRDYGPRTQLRITTVEQTLLDALYKPFHAGGPAVVLEAWQEAASTFRFDEERMSQYLVQMQFPATARRVGAIIEMISYSPGNELRRVLNDSMTTVNSNSPYAEISLLPGIEYQSINRDWLVKIP